VWAVVRGTAVTNDGRSQKAGFAAPSAAAQAAAVRRAMREARVSPRDVSYVECHATATNIGDGIEVHGLLDAFRTEGGEVGAGEAGWCALGSIKGNIGHANCAAGLSAVIKLALCLRHQTLVPTANFRQLSPKLPLAGSPFYVNEGAVPWTQRARGWTTRGGAAANADDANANEREADASANANANANANDAGGGGGGGNGGGGGGRGNTGGRVGALPGQPLVGGVSSFGIGGTNAHAVLATDEAGVAAAARGSGGRRRQVLAFSARTPGALQRLRDKLVGHLAAAHELETRQKRGGGGVTSSKSPTRQAPWDALADMAFTLQTSRTAVAGPAAAVVVPWRGRSWDSARHVIQLPPPLPRNYNARWR